MKYSMEDSLPFLTGSIPNIVLDTDHEAATRLASDCAITYP